MPKTSYTIQSMAIQMAANALFMGSATLNDCIVRNSVQKVLTTIVAGDDFSWKVQLSRYRYSQPTHLPIFSLPITINPP